MRRSLGRFSSDELRGFLEATTDTIWLPQQTGPTPARQVELRDQRRRRWRAFLIPVSIFIIASLIAAIVRWYFR